MNRSLVAAGAAALALAAGSASAQGYPSFPYGGQPQAYGSGESITFYEGENFSGRQITVYGEERDFARVGFNDRARSAQTNGSFIVCEHKDFDGRCERISGSVRNLDRLGLNARISSVRTDRAGGYDDPYDGRAGRDDDDPGRGDGYGAPRRDGVQGRSVIFFARPTVGGNDVAARGQGSADQFCRASGYGGAVYFTQGERSRRAVDQDGRVVDAPALRDVLCRLR